MNERIAILLAVAGGILVAGILVKAYARRRRQLAIERVQLPAHAGGQSSIISFFGPSCDACDRQKLELKELQARRPGQMSVELRDASLDYEYARQFGLVIVPTTVVVRPSGAIAGINTGFTAGAVLEAQLEAA